MIANIDVLVDKAIGTAKFRLESVSLYNTYTKGRVVPDASNVTNKVVTSPTLTGETIKKGPLKYTDFTTPGTPEVAMRGVIYSFETKASATTDRQKATCLVIGGKYQGSSNETFYRVDLLHKSKKTFLDILRNHQYLVNIIKVDGPGFPTAEEAFNSPGVNMDTEVLEWEDKPDMGSIATDGDYYLSVSRDEFTLSRKPT